MDIAQFLAARLDEDEAAAEAASHYVLREKWHAVEWYDGEFVASGRRTAHVDIHGLAGAPITSRGALRREDAEHIARHDPARVLAEVAAKRRVLARHYGSTSTPLRAICEGCAYNYADIDPRYHLDECPELRDLAAIYADHPDFDPSWRVPTTEENRS